MSLWTFDHLTLLAFALFKWLHKLSSSSGNDQMISYKPLLLNLITYHLIDLLDWANMQYVDCKNSSPSKLANCNTDSIKKNVRGITYVCTELIFDSPEGSCTTKYFLKKVVVHIFTLRLAHFAPKLVNHSRHSESLKYVWKSTISCLRRKMSSISEFFRMFKDSLWHE